MNPCKSNIRIDRCPPLSDSDSDSANDGVEDEIKSKTSNNVSEHESVNETPSCFFLDRSNVSGTRTDSITKLETESDVLQRQIENIELEKFRIQMEIRGKKQKLVDAIMKVVEFERTIQCVEVLIAEKLHHFQSRIIVLEAKRMEIFENSGDEKVHDLLEREIDEIKEEFEQQSKKDETDKEELTQQAQEFAAQLGDIIREYQNYFDEMIAKEAVLTNEEIVKLRNEFNYNMTQLHRLLSRPAQFCHDKTGERFFLDERKEKVFKVDLHSSEYKMNIEGNLQKIKAGFDLEKDENGEFYVGVGDFKIYTKYFFEDEFGRFYLDVHANRVYKTDPEASEYKLVNGKWKKVKDGIYETDERGLRVKPKTEVEIANEIFEASPEGEAAKASERAKDDDINYIQQTVGPAIRKALAAVALHQPADPINYFANFLLHYRDNQLMFAKREEDLKRFIEFREKLKQQESCEQNSK